MTAWIIALLASERIDVALFFAAFVSATLFPGGSEVLLSGAIAGQPQNTLGAMTSWAIGRFIPTMKKTSRAIEWLRRWGAWALFFSWLPVVGDALPLAAGWLRIDPWLSLAVIALGKLIRYAVLAAAVLQVVL